MPFELGLDLGCRRFKAGKHGEKRCLILDKEKYRYQKAISDLSGNDIAYHQANPELLVRAVRNWLFHIHEEKLPSGKALWTFYNDFTTDFYKITREANYSREDVEVMPWSEYKLYIKEWITNREERR